VKIEDNHFEIIHLLFTLIPASAGMTMQIYWLSSSRMRGSRFLSKAGSFGPDIYNVKMDEPVKSLIKKVL